MDYPCLPAERLVNMEAGCRYLYISSTIDFFNPHCHDYYELFLTISGTITHWVNGVTTKLPEGSLVFIRPDDVHGYIYDNPNRSETAYINFSFTRETAEQLFSYLSEGFPSQYLLSCDMPPTVTLTQAEKKQLFLQISALNTVDWKDKHQLKLRARVLLADIFMRFFTNIPNIRYEAMPLWLTMLIRNMEQPENFTAGIDHMTALSGKSREHLSRNLKKYLNLTPSEYINDLRINYSANLLINTNSTIIDICYQCGFQNLSHFYRTFQKKYHQSPGEFRKLHKSNE